jgi:TrpR family trp operon transcriptional repressor
MTNDAELIESNISEMAKALEKADAQLIVDFLACLLTPSEMDEIAKRWALVKEIATGRPQREIAKDLGLSLCKITRGSRELKKESSAFKSMIELAGFEVPDVIARRRAPRSHETPAEASAGASAGAGPDEPQA